MRPSCKSYCSHRGGIFPGRVRSGDDADVRGAAEETAFGMASLSVHNQTSQPVQIRVEDEVLGVVGRFEYQFFQIPDHLARRSNVTLTARNMIGDVWYVNVAGINDHYHWTIQPQ